jgi:hypothetical protein
LHFREETGDWVGIKAPYVVLYKCSTNVVRKISRYCRGEQTTGGTDNEIAAATGRIKHTNVREVPVGCISTGIEYALN